MKLLNNLVSVFSKNSKKEQVALQQWKENYLKEITALQELHPEERLSKKAELYKDFNPDQAWRTLEGKMGNTGKDTKVVNLWKPYMKWAAVFLLISGALWMWSSNEVGANNQEQFLAGAEVLNIDLMDASHVVLEPKTSLVQNSFRHVKLLGTGTFDIKKNPEHPFIIETQQGQVKVLGTSFLLISMPDSTRIEVTEGRVELSWEQGVIILEAGDVAVIKKQTLVYYARGNDVMADWEHNILQFDNVELQEAIKVIAEHFNVEIIWPNVKSEANCTIRSRFQNSSLESVLKELSLITDFEYKVEGQKIVISRMC